MTDASTRPASLELRDVAKSFGAVQALRLRLDAGASRARSTRWWGRTAPASPRWSRSSPASTAATRGDLLLEGTSVDFASTAESKAAGVAVIYQEPTLFPDLSVTENIFMGRQILGAGRRIDRGAMYAEAERLFAGLGVHIDPRRPALGLSIADQQIIEIAKAISLDARVLIMDEPTAALSGVEVERLFTVARRLRDEGRALVFISHRFDEVFDLCDTITVMRDGAYVDTLAVAETDVDQMVALMVGREVGDLFPKTPGDRRRARARGARPRAPPASSTTSASRSVPARSSAWPAWSAPDAARSPARSSASTATTPARCAAGRQSVPPRNPRAAIRAGMAFIPEDRRKQGLVIDASVARNVAGVIRGRLSRLGFLTQRAENQAAAPWAVAPRGQDQRPGHERHHDERRQPAEGRHRQVAGHRAAAADHRRADPRHRRRHQGRGAPAALRARRPGDGDPDDLLRAARGARHGRPGPRGVARAGSPPTSPATRPPRRT